MEQESLKQAVAKIKWHHRIDLGNGIVTPGYDDSPRKLKRLGFPESFAGKTVLDVGAWDGFFSFEAERRGAKRVLATDSFSWSGSGWGTKAGFDLARQALNSRVEDQQIDVLELSPAKIGGTYDVVLFLGVLYHMRHPMLALERVAGVTGEQLILETVVDCLHTSRPMIAFYPDAELSNDASNWCGPNPAAVEGMLKTAGFQTVNVVADHRTFFFRLAKAAYCRFKWGYSFRTLLRTDRMVFHAWR
jgi:tRNA (mo5U34)-methyltransferase